MESKKTEPIKLNPDNLEEYRKTTFQDLINDAVARGDNKAVEWLATAVNETITRTRSDGSTYTVRRGTPSIRSEYYATFLNYKKKSGSSEAARKKKAEKKQQELDAMIEAARNLLNAANKK